jgi:U3 small nucleolar RNA-associated protein 14
MKFSRRPGGTPTTKSSAKFGKSKTQANVAGYEKRQARKKKPATTTSDLYEHIPEKTRRSKVNLDLDRDEAMEYSVGIDGANGEKQEELRARLIGEGMDDEEIASDDDEEIDSDAAFEESDEERFAGFFSSKVGLACHLPRISNAHQKIEI